MDRDGGLARAVAVALGLPSHPIRVIEGRGAVNHVYVTGVRNERWVIRFARDPLCDNVFEAEAWAMTRAASQGLPTPAVRAFGELYGIPFGVQRFVAGRPLTGDTDPQPWSTLGAYGRVVNGISPDESAPAALLSRFGPDLDSAWAHHLAYNLDQLDSHDALLHEGVLTRQQHHGLRESVVGLSGQPLSFGLSHGDLVPRNLIEADSGLLVLIDWGSARFGPTPWTDLLNIDRDARLSGTAAEPHLEAFLDGMGLGLAAIWPTFERFRRLQLLDLVRWATDQRPDQRQRTVADLIAVL